jgi:hypothetical protein
MGTALDVSVIMHLPCIAREEIQLESLYEHAEVPSKVRLPSTVDKAVIIESLDF